MPQRSPHRRSAVLWGAWALAVCLAGGGEAVAGDDPFDAHWHDGRAELNGYRWRITRYGQRRVGQAVLIYVTEPFSRTEKVKVDNPRQNPRDTHEVLKLNMVRDFQTGIYDYNTMVSVFSRSDRFSPEKISFTSAEWCGHVYEQLLYEPDRIESRIDSYFQGESSASSLERRPDGVTEDNLYILLRGLRQPWLAPGQTVSLPYLPGTLHRRLNHRPLSWSKARFERKTDPAPVTVPAGTFETTVYTVKTAQGREGEFFIERDYPHRIIRWRWRSGGSDPDRSQQTAELTGSQRLKYWSLNGNGHEHHLRALGLMPLVR